MSIFDDAFGQANQAILSTFGDMISYDSRGYGDAVSINAALTWGVQIESDRNVIGSAIIAMSDMPDKPLDSDLITFGGKLYQVVDFSYDGIGGSPEDQWANKTGTCTVYFRFVRVLNP